MAVSENFFKKCKRRYPRDEETLPHSCFVGPNLHTESNVDSSVWENFEMLANEHEYFPFKTTLPVPLGSPAVISWQQINGVDPVLQLVNEKSRFNAECQKVLSANKSTVIDEKLENALKNKKSSKIGIHPNLAALAEVMSRDPDPHFSGQYNFYYKNNLTTCNVGGRTFVAHSPIHGKLSFGLLNSENETCGVEETYEVEHILSGKSKQNEGPVFQLESTKDLLFTRTLNRCGLFQLCKEEKISLKKLSLAKSETVFTSAALNTFKYGEFTTLTPNYVVEVHQVSNEDVLARKIDLRFLQNDGGVWGSVHYHDENVLMFCNRRSINLIDLREPKIGSFNITEWDTLPKTELCEDIYSAAKGKYSHYVTTSHSLLCLDIRKGWNQRWTHGLPHSPSLISVLPEENGAENVLIASQTGGNVACINSSTTGEFELDFLKTPPYLLPTMRETLHKARVYEYCTSPLVRSRFSMSITGIAADKIFDNVDLILCSSFGDLFTQRMSLSCKTEKPFDFELSEFELNTLRSWEVECCKQFSSMDHTTHANSLHVFHKLLDNSQDNSDEVPSENPPETPQTIQPWMKSKQALAEYCDVLAPKLLATWELKADDDWGDANFVDDSLAGSEDESSEEDDVETRVRNWLDQSALQMSQSSIDVPEENLKNESGSES